MDFILLASCEVIEFVGLLCCFGHGAFGKTVNTNLL